MKAFLFKSVQEDPTTPDKFQTALAQKNIISEIIPVITFNFCNLKKLFQKLKSDEIYSGIILSSLRCVSSMEKAISSHASDKTEKESILKSWENSPKIIFCVGRATAELAQKLFPNSQNIVISPNENAESLGNQICQVLKTRENPVLLYPTGNLKSDTLQNILSSENIGTDNVIVYETVQNPELRLLISNLVVEDDSPFVFFSPSGLQNTLCYAKGLILTKDRPLIAIGPTTRDAILKIGGVNENDVFECESPSPEGVTKCVTEIMSKSCTK